MDDQEKDNGGERGPRSPGYPGIDLASAIDRAAALKAFSPARKPIPVDSALAQWKYAPKSGAGLQQLAALKKYGLLVDSGAKDRRVVTLTDRAWIILTDPRPDSPKKKQAIAEAALSPKINAEIRARWPYGLPDDTTMLVWLVQEKKFNEDAVARFLKDLRATFEYAKLDSLSDLGTNDDDSEDDGSDDGSGSSSGNPGPRRLRKAKALAEGVKEDVFTLDSGDQVVVQWPSSLTDQDCTDIDDWIEIVKRKIRRGVVARTNDRDPNEQDQ